MLETLGGDKADAVYAASMLRLLRNCPDARKWGPILAAAKSPAPLVRAAAAEVLADATSKEALAAVTELADDDFRLVRIRAAASLTGVPAEAIAPQRLAAVKRATAEYLESLQTRPDLWTSQYNLGNYALGQGDPAKAVACYEKARRLDPAATPPLVNLAIASSQLGDTARAEAALKDALRLSPDDAPAHFNLGLLIAEQGDAAGAEKHLRAAFAADPTLAAAAYNLALLTAPRNPGEALAWSAKAYALRPGEPRYASLYAMFLARAGNTPGTPKSVRPGVTSQPGS